MAQKTALEKGEMLKEKFELENELSRFKNLAMFPDATCVNFNIPPNEEESLSDSAVLPLPTAPLLKKWTCL